MITYILAILVSLPIAVVATKKIEGRGRRWTISTLILLGGLVGNFLGPVFIVLIGASSLPLWYLICPFIGAIAGLAFGLALGTICRLNRFILSLVLNWFFMLYLEGAFRYWYPIQEQLEACSESALCSNPSSLWSATFGDIFLWIFGGSMFFIPVFLLTSLLFILSVNLERNPIYWITNVAVSAFYSFVIASLFTTNLPQSQNLTIRWWGLAASSFMLAMISGLIFRSAHKATAIRSL